MRDLRERAMDETRKFIFSENILEM